MNSFGRLFRVNISGESHGPAVAILIDGCPAGLPINEEDFKTDLARRQGASAPGTTPRRETDNPKLISGVFQGKTSGAPLLILFENQDTRSDVYERLKDTPRPGQADFTARGKFGGLNDYRGGGHFSGRLTVGLVAAGVLAKKIIEPMQVSARILEVGGSKQVQQTVADALKDRDSVGGLLECTVSELPVGLGEPFFDSVESVLSHAIFSIPGVKGIEFGAGFGCAGMRGSEFNDIFLDASGRTTTNNSGGLNGGITNGNPLVLRVAVRPTASIAKAQKTVSLTSGQTTQISVEGRHDACIALRVPVILEAVTAIVLADFMLLEQKASRIME